MPVITFSGCAWNKMLDQRHVLYRLAGKIDWSAGREQMKEQMVKDLKRLRSAIPSFQGEPL